MTAAAISASMSAAEIAEFAPPGAPPSDLRAPLRTALIQSGEYGPGQTAGRFHPGACAALEITQRCNLDCTLCYLSDAAELAHDIPLPILFRRIDMMARHLGRGASLQITGGDPTLRKPEDLEALCRHIRAAGLRACLMTNGIKATRPLLARLAKAGLNDVAFHVDLTQERKGHPTEASLNAIRREYIARARGLSLRILFNTTICDANLAEIPVVARFFRDHARQVTLASFQMQAHTGRGSVTARGGGLTRAAAIEAIETGFGADLHFNTAAVGHSGCNRYAVAVVAGDKATSALANARLFQDGVAALETADDGKEPYIRLAPTLLRAALRRPDLALRVLAEGARILWRVRGGLTRRPARIAILIHAFMDAEELERDRCEACVFKVATEAGPLSMCVHNARRDHHLFAPARVEGGWWNAATGRVTQAPSAAAPAVDAAPLKQLKGRLRSARLAARGRDGVLNKH